MNLRARIERLESAGTAGVQPVLILNLAGPGRMARVTCGSQQWTRHDGEGDAALLARARTEASRPAPGKAQYFLCEGNP